MPAGENFQVGLLYDGNPYYTYVNIGAGTERIAEFPAVPGRTAQVWIALEQNGRWSLPFEDRRMPARSVEIPEAEPVTRSAFTTEAWLAAVPARETVGDTDRLPPAEFSRALLEDGGQRLYLQVVNSYQVPETIEENLLITLTTPEGWCFWSAAGFIWGPEYQDSDVWHAEVTDLFGRCFEHAGGFAPGTYTLSYYIHGDLGQRVILTLPGDTLNEGMDSL